MGDWLQRFHALDQETNPSPDRSDRSDRGLSGLTELTEQGIFLHWTPRESPAGGAPVATRRVLALP
jgi:hypothetical protein